MARIMLQKNPRFAKILFVIFMGLALFCGAELYLSMSGSLTPEALIQSITISPANFLFLAGGLICLVIAIGSLLLFSESDISISSRQDVLVQRANMRYEWWKERYNAEMHQPPDYTFDRRDLVDRGNFYLRIWTLYMACMGIIFLVIWSDTMTESPAAQYTLVGMIIALLPASWLQIRYTRTAGMVVGYGGITEGNAFKFLATIRGGRGSGPIGMATMIFAIFAMGIIFSGTLYYHLTLYDLFTTYMFVLIFGFLITLGITYARFRLRDEVVERPGD
ncbi:hypothetical protein Mboo_2029 [Methanoregula boonei 6A8]|jgi:hypothetical protein|uniref:Uncharacterized protein n=1 Tax=Methanoregula boonei (strain DSM 21154 / JCM 14090 / 6A8) TaxID=456442 RepID=A7I9Y2_METB6|nr:hypothetical protein [Methanoregula boonei]ABS56543.1 hypothetical protein Mboo_2029 [Methanoregula boonei 6A8]